MLQCPHCGWRYTPQQHGKNTLGVSAFEHVPDHLDGGTVFRKCDGSGQRPRNAESDRRPLWKEGGVK